MKSFTVNKVQRGYWGGTVLGTITVKAQSEDEALMKIAARKDYGKRLKNGDSIAYELVVERT